MDKNALILLRGLPGSGKSTLADLLSENGKYPVFSVDDYFMNTETGEYHFRFNENHLAYAQCEKNVRKAMEKRTEKIFLANTFTIDWELQTYFKLAKELDYTLHVVTVENYHQSKNVHDITDEQLRKMAEKYKVRLY